MTTRRIEVVDADDPRFVHLRLHQNLLIATLIILTIMAGSLTYGVAQNLRADHDQAVETARLRDEVASQKAIIDNANATSRANTEFLRCAFLIEPDVDKSEPVIDRCIEQAQFPDDRR